MIQNHSIRHLNTSIGLVRPAQSDGPEEWGTWHGRKHYSIEIVQHPSRARMCGFGDKDRRPLAPAAVAKMIVRRDDNSPVDVDDVDCSFFLVTVDLWSYDGKQEMNLVQHPSSTERYISSTVPGKPRKREKSSATPTTAIKPAQTPGSGPGPQPHSRPGEPPTPLMTPQPYSNPGYPFPPPHPPTLPDMPYYQPTWGYSAAQPVDRNTTYPPPVLPSIQSFGRPATASEGQNDAWQNNTSAGTDVYRSWQSNFNTTDTYANGSTPNPSPSRDSSERRESWAQNDPSQSPPSPHVESNSTPYAAAPTSYSAPQSTLTSFSQPPYAPPSSSGPPYSRHTFTRTLVGPLCANATRLLDEHRKPGIFFLFQDLSVRTEGTFRLRMRLMNVGAPPGPEAGATHVHTEVSPVLAQSFTEPFTVYSAKRFPGVPDTTALSIAFGNQGQKLPLRNRHGSGKRRRRDGSGSDDDSDGD